MKQEKLGEDVPSLDELRKRGFASRIPNGEARADEWTEIRPGRRRKVYGTSPNVKVHWQFRPMQMFTKDAPESKPLPDFLPPLDDLREQAISGLRWMLLLAKRGDQRAIDLFSNAVRRAASSLEHLAQIQPEKVKASAELQTGWPVVLNLNPKRIRRVKDLLRHLCVGKKALTPTNENQRLDPDNFWTGLAARALSACDINRDLVSIYESHVFGIKPKCETRRLWEKEITFKCYTMRTGDIIKVSDWEEECARLPVPITRECYKLWWDVVRECVRQHWHDCPEEYEQAISLASAGGLRKEKDYTLRANALDRVEQAFRALVGLTGVKKPPIAG